MRKYTTEDFQKAQFARADDGLLAIRAFPTAHRPWLFVTKRGSVAGRPDGSMAWEGWEPVTDQTPGITITKSRFAPLRGIHVHSPETGIAVKIQDYLGLTIVDDPAPTNAEKLAKEILTSFNRCEFDFETSFEQLAKALDARGIKAPGDEDSAATGWPWGDDDD